MLGKQLVFKLPEINREITQQNVEEAIEAYRMCLLTVPEEKLPKVTASYSLIPPSNTNGFHSTTKDIAIERADDERERIEYVDRFRKAVNRLSPKEGRRLSFDTWGTRNYLIMRYITN